MKVILLRDVQDLGNKGEIVDVANGYARNYLVPRSLAVNATDGALRQADGLRKAREESERRSREEADQVTQALLGTRVVVAARSGDEGKLFGSIGAVDVVEAIKKFTGIEVDRSVIHIQTPIKEIGLHEVSVRPHPDVEFQLSLDVIPA